MKCILLVSLLLLAGCKVEMEIPINLSELKTKKILSKELNVFIEVATCHSYEDSRNESKQLIKLKKQVATKIPRAKYKQCFSKKMQSFAEYKMPFAVVPTDFDYKNVDGDALRKKYIGLLASYTNEDGGLSTQFNIFNAFKKQLIEISEEQPVNFSIRLSEILKNDTSEKQFFTIYSHAYVDDYAFSAATGWFKPNETRTITLSDAASDYLLQVSEKGEPPRVWDVLIATEKEQELLNKSN